MTVYYLSGPMRGLPDYNRAQFMDVERALGNVIGYLNYDPETEELISSHRIINPTRNFDGDQGLEPSVYMALDLKQVLDADVIVLLPGWRNSEGARREAQLAIWADKDFIEAGNGDTGHWTFWDADIVSATENTSARAVVVQKAEALITGDRNNTYGPPHQDFRRSADAMTAYGYRHTQLPASAPVCLSCGARPLQSYDTAIAVDCVKTSRIMWSPTKEDHWVDKAGYAGCGYECAIEDDKEKRAG